MTLPSTNLTCPLRNTGTFQARSHPKGRRLNMYIKRSKKCVMSVSA